MRPLTWARLLSVVGGALAFGWGGSSVIWGTGATPVPLPGSLAVVMVVIGAIAVVTAWPVREYLGGRVARVDAIKAARTAVLAQASAFTAAVVTGLASGYALSLASDWAHGPRREVILSALLVMGAAVVAMIAAVIAERWCRIDDSDDDTAQAEPSP